MSHRNSDIPSWNNNRNSHNDGGGGGNYKERNWTGSNRYNSDNRYSKDRRSFRGYGGRRNFDDRRGNHYRRNANNGSDCGTYNPYQRHHNSWTRGSLDKANCNKNDSGNSEGLPFQPIVPVELMHQIPPLQNDFPDPEIFQDQPDNSCPAKDTCGIETGIANGNRESSLKALDSSDGTKSWADDIYPSPGEAFQDFAETEGIRSTKPAAPEISTDVDNPEILSPTAEEKLEITPQENELIKLIEDEALKMINDAEQPTCSISSPQGNSVDGATSAATVVTSATTSERRASIERSAEQVTRKLINQLTSMNKYNLKQMINNPDSKYETALKTHARQKLRAEVRRQLRNFSLSDTSTPTKSSCGILQPDECVDSDKIPDALLEQIGKVLDLNLLDLNVSEEQVPVTAVEDDDCVINQSDTDPSATEVLDKNLRLTDDDCKLDLDADDIFARAELLLMKGSESVRISDTSGPNSPTDEMFPNDQIDSIVSEENSGFEKTLDFSGSDDDDKVEQMLDERLNEAFPCFLRVSTVEELNKKVDELSNENEDQVDSICQKIIPSVASRIDLDDPVCSIEPTVDLSEEPLLSAGSLETVTAVPQAIEPMDDIQVASILSEPSLPEVTASEGTSADDESAQTVEHENQLPEPSNAKITEADKQQSSDLTGKISQELGNGISPSSEQLTAEVSSAALRAPTHPELTVRKSRSSKTYKPNLVTHDHLKRDKTSSAAPSQVCNNSPSSNSKSQPKDGSNLTAAKQSNSGTASPSKHHPVSSSSTTSTSNDGSSTNTNNHSSSSSRVRSQRKRDSSVKESSSTSHSLSSFSAIPANGNLSDSPSKSSNKGSCISMEGSPVPSLTVPAGKTQPVRAQTPGPSTGAAHHTGSDKKKKKKRNKRKERSPDMVLECDLRVSRPAVTPTPPPVASRDTNPTSAKKNNESERPPRDTRAKSVDPRNLYDGKRDRDKDRNREKSRPRELEKDADREKDKRERRDAEREERKERDREIRKEKESFVSKVREERTEKDPIASNCSNDSIQLEVTKQVSQSGELLTPKMYERDRRKSPALRTVSKTSGELLKHSKESRDTKEIIQDVAKEEKDLSKIVAKENLRTKDSVPSEKGSIPSPSKEQDIKEISKEKETIELSRKGENRDSSKEKYVTKDCIKTKPVKEKETREISKEREVREVSKEKEVKPDLNAVVRDTEMSDKELMEVSPPTTAMAQRSSKRKKSLLRGPNLVKGRKEVIVTPEVSAVSTQAEESKCVPDISDTGTSSPVQTFSQPFQSQNRNKEITTVESDQPCESSTTKPASEIMVSPSVQQAAVRHRIIPEAASSPAAAIEQPTQATTVPSIIHRTASPRPWKSPGEKKIIPATPLLPNPNIPTFTSPPPAERHRPARTPTPPSPAVTSPEPEPQPCYVTTARAAEQELLARLSLPTPSFDPVTAFAPVMAILNQMQEIDSRMNDLQRRKMQIDSEILRLNTEKFQIDHTSTQLQNDRYMVLGALRAALVECELNTLARLKNAAQIATVCDQALAATRKRVAALDEEIAPKSKRRKADECQQETPNSPPVVSQPTVINVSGPELSEPEEAMGQGTSSNAAAVGGEQRTIRKITKISENTQIMKLFQRRRLMSDKSVEESHSEDSTPADKPATTAKRRRTRTTASEVELPTRSVARLRSNSSRTDCKKPVDVTAQPQPNASAHQSAEGLTLTHISLKKDKEIPVAAHRNLLTREVKVVLSKLNVASRRGSNT